MKGGGPSYLMLKQSGDDLEIWSNITGSNKSVVLSDKLIPGWNTIVLSLSGKYIWIANSDGTTSVTFTVTDLD